MFPRRQSFQGHQLDCPGYSDDPTLSAVTFRVEGKETPRKIQDQERVILRCFSGFYRSFQTRSDRNDAHAGGKCIRSIPRSLLLGSADPSLISQYPQEEKILDLAALTLANSSFDLSLSASIDKTILQDGKGWVLR
jgi:hypothetical protein